MTLIGRGGPSDNESWADMTDAQRWAYVQRLERAVCDMGRDLGTLRQQRAGAVDAGDTFKAEVVDALRMAKGDEMVERIWKAVEEYNLVTGGGAVAR